MYAQLFLRNARHGPPEETCAALCHLATLCATQVKTQLSLLSRVLMLHLILCFAQGDYESSWRLLGSARELLARDSVEMRGMMICEAQIRHQRALDQLDWATGPPRRKEKRKTIRINNKTKITSNWSL